MTTRTRDEIIRDLDDVDRELELNRSQRLTLEAEHLLLRAELRAAERMQAVTERPYDARIFAIIDGTQP